MSKYLVNVVPIGEGTINEIGSFYAENDIEAKQIFYQIACSYFSKNLSQYNSLDLSYITKDGQQYSKQFAQIVNQEIKFSDWK